MSQGLPEGLDPILAARLRELAQARGWTPEQAFSMVLERGLMEYESDTAADLEAAEAEALRQAIAALEQIPDDAFAAIGKTPRDDG